MTNGVNFMATNAPGSEVKPLCPVCGKGEYEFWRARFLDCAQQEHEELERMRRAVERAIVFVKPGGYDEALARRVLTDHVVYAFAYVATQEHKRAEKAEKMLDMACAELETLERTAPEWRQYFGATLEDSP